jgi:hypothetical protein
MATIVEVPDFNFRAFYYAEILDALITYRRTFAPEITDENEHEPYVQLERAFALVGHLNNVLLDFAAKESLLPTATLRSSVKNILKLIGYELSEATPSSVELLLELSKVFNAPATYVPARSNFATPADVDVDSVVFENLVDYDVERTDRAGGVFALESSVFTDYTTESYTPASPFTPWTTPVAGDILYIGHDSVMWDAVEFTLSGVGSGLDGTWEYYDGTFGDQNPDSVTDLGTQLEFDLTGLLGAQNRAGATVRAIFNNTSAFEDVVTTWNGSKNIATTGLLGQVTPSTLAIDYTVGTEWHPLADLDSTIDGTVNFTQSGTVAFELPQTVIKNWAKTTINGLEAFWIRYRIVNVSTPTSPSIDLVDITAGKQYALPLVTQGTTRAGEVMGSSLGTANQSFVTLRNEVIEASQTVYVDAVAWDEVPNFLNSTSVDTHYTFEADDDGFGVVTFGNGSTGKIPPVGVDNITIDYRIGAEVDGNVGRGTIVLNQSGVAFINRLSNPRSATGWFQRRGSTAEDLELVKEEGPASLRTLNRAVTPTDVEDLTVAFIASNGSNPVSRAKGIEEGFGIKTIEVVVVGTGGGTVPNPVKIEIEDYFNGNEAAGIDGVLVLNHQVGVTDFVTKTIDVTATVFGGTATQIENAIKALLHPEAKTADGLRFEWDFGEEVPRSRIISQIFDVLNVRKVTLTTPATDVSLAPKELPLYGTIILTVEP